MTGLLSRAAALHHRHPAWSWGLRGLVSIALIAWVLASLDVGDLGRVMIRPQWIYLGAMVLMGWLFLVIGSVKYWILFRARTPVRLAPFIGYFVIASSFGVLTPAGLGEFTLVALLRREQVRAHDAMAAMLVDRAITFAVYAFIFLPLTAGLYLDAAWTWWVPVLAVPGGAAFLLAFSRFSRLRSDLHRRLLRYPFTLIADFLRAVSVLLRERPWHLLANLGLTLVRCVVSALVVLSALWAAGAWPPFPPVLYVTNSLSLVTLLPVSVAGVGVYEGGGVALLGGLGFDQERVFAALVYQRIYLLAFALLCLGLSPLLTRALRARPAAPAEEPAA